MDNVTFFLKNFPEIIESEVLVKRFNEIANVKDLFIPKRSNNKGNRFGFIRFENDINSREVENNLNKVWFESFKLVANFPKYSRSEV